MGKAEKIKKDGFLFFMRLDHVFIFIILFFFINNCQYFSLLHFNEWKDASSGIEKDPDVYVCGRYIISSNYYPCYWKNGERVDLPYIGADNDVYSITVEADDVYCGGYYRNLLAVRNACYWENNKLIKVDLDDENQTSYIYSICVVSGVVFAAGEEAGKACFWINKKKYPLNVPGGANSSAKAIAVDRETMDFYIAGYYGATTVAYYWKNGGEAIRLDDSGAINSGAFAVQYSNGKVYIGGYYRPVGPYIPCYWVDGKRFDLPYSGSASQANGLAVINGSVYSAGKSNTPAPDFYAGYWKDQTLIWESIITPSLLNGITVYNNDVYIAGHSGDVARYWKNGNEVLLPTKVGTVTSIANSIFVKAKGM